MDREFGENGFESINSGYNAVFKPNRMTVGLVAPLAAYHHHPVPSMTDHLQRTVMAETLGFPAIWLRDVPFNVPSFGDAGQIYDPFVYLGALAVATERIALGVASIILPLRHPAHVAKAAASADVLSNGRLILGVASGDRPEEFPALNMPFDSRGERFRQSYEYMRHAHSPGSFEGNDFGRPGRGMDLLPQPAGTKLPLLITGSSQQSVEWTARHGDGWMIYPRNLSLQRQVISEYRERVQQNERESKPVMQPLYLDLASDDSSPLQPIHLGFRSGVSHLLEYLHALQGIGVNHVALNLRFNRADINSTLHRLAEEVLPHFQHQHDHSGETP